MATHRLVVFTQPKPGQEAEYNRWYDEVHLGDVLKVEGFVAAQRFEVATAQIGDAAEAAPARYLAIYEIEAETLEAALAQLSAALTAWRCPTRLMSARRRRLRLQRSERDSFPAERPPKDERKDHALGATEKGPDRDLDY